MVAYWIGAEGEGERKMRVEGKEREREESRKWGGKRERKKGEKET